MYHLTKSTSTKSNPTDVDEFIGVAPSEDIEEEEFSTDPDPENPLPPKEPSTVDDELNEDEDDNNEERYVEGETITFDKSPSPVPEDHPPTTSGTQTSPPSPSTAASSIDEQNQQNPPSPPKPQQGKSRPGKKKQQVSNAVDKTPSDTLNEEQGNGRFKCTLTKIVILVLVLCVLTMAALLVTGAYADTGIAVVKNESEEPVESVASEDEGLGGDGEDKLPMVDGRGVFNRIASFPVCSQLDKYCNTDVKTNAKHVVAANNGRRLVYTDTELSLVGVVDISDPAQPVPAGTVGVGGYPTSLIMYNDYIVVPVDTSVDHRSPSGVLKIIDISTGSIYHEMDLDGQPDKIALSPSMEFIAVAIKNEHGDEFPMFPAGFLLAIDSSDPDPKQWVSKRIDLTGLNGVYEPDDPEPTGVSINENNLAVVTLQVNNAIVLIDLNAPEIIDSYDAGEIDMEHIDIVDDQVVTLSHEDEEIEDVPREPDGVAWIHNDFYATADEGSKWGGTRSFTIFGATGSEYYESENELDYAAMRIGQYPDSRSDRKGVEPEIVVYAEYGESELLFVVSERANIVYVYDVSFVEEATLLQILPAGCAEPEGAHAIPSRGLFVVSCSGDSRENGVRSHVTIYQLQPQEIPDYPSIVSMDREDLTPRPFSSLSALASGGGRLYSIDDSAFLKNRIFTIDPTTYPYTIVDDVRISDSKNELFDALNTGSEYILLNADKTVNFDLEGIDLDGGEGFWVCNEGKGNYGDFDRTPNLLIRLDNKAIIQEIVRLPQSVDRLQQNGGYGGLAVQGEYVVVAFQRAWRNETHPRLGLYNTEDKSWKFIFYPSDVPTSFLGGNVLVSDIESLGDGNFLVLERDEQSGPDAAIKRVYMIELGDLSTLEEGSLIVGKRLIRDLLPDLGGNKPVIGKVEGIAVDDSGNVWVNNDNDGVTGIDGNSGENLLLNLGEIL